MGTTHYCLIISSFLRVQKEYYPPEDVEFQLEAIFKSVIGLANRDYRLADLSLKSNLFKMCSDKIGHCIPSSLLHTITTLKDVIQFYKTPIDIRTPLDKMRSMELPENLHVQFEYHRFHPGKRKRSLKNNLVFTLSRLMVMCCIFVVNFTAILLSQKTW